MPNGKPYGPERYKDIVKERYIIAKQGNISYEDTSKMTPTEREYILRFILEDLRTQEDLIAKQLIQQNKGL